MFGRFAGGACSPEEERELAALVLNSRYEAVVRDLLEQYWHTIQPENRMPEAEGLAMIKDILYQRSGPQKQQAVVHFIRRGWKRLAVAAAVMLVIGTGGYVYFRGSNPRPPASLQVQQKSFNNDIAPGKYKARLTLADGTTIVLDSAATGQLARQEGAAVFNKAGQLVYQVTGKPAAVVYNTLTTAKGETYATVLADGTKVWLNSAATIKFPVVFQGSERRVEITGEAYFEVAQNKAQPFIVTKNNMEVQVLGTHFNVDAYDDEPDIKVTLLEGRIKVRSHSGLDPESSGKQNNPVLLKPGQQATLRHSKPDSESIKVTSAVDLEQVMAWKNGRFEFNETDIQTIMRQIVRWYDVEVVFEGNITQHFNGTINRQVTVAKVLNMLEKTGGVRFAVEGRKVVVKKF